MIESSAADLVARSDHVDFRYTPDKQILFDNTSTSPAVADDRTSELLGALQAPAPST